MKLKPMTNKEKEIMININYISNKMLRMVVMLLSLGELGALSEEDYDAIVEQMICDYCFGETYMLRQK